MGVEDMRSIGMDWDIVDDVGMDIPTDLIAFFDNEATMSPIG